MLSPTYLTEAAGVETSSLFPLWVITLLFLSMVIPFFVGTLCQHDTIKHMLCLHHLHIYILDLLFMEVSNIIVARVLPSNLQKQLDCVLIAVQYFAKGYNDWHRHHTK